MFRKVLVGILVMAVTFAFVTACSGDSGDSQVDSSPSVEYQDSPAVDNSGGNSGDYDELSDEEYESQMLQVKQVVEAQVMEFNALLQEAYSGFDSEEDLIAWCQDFMMLKNTFDIQAEALASDLPNLPERFLETHTLVTFALAAMTDAMQGFSDAVDAYNAGNEEAFWDGLDVLGDKMELAGDLWEQAYE